MTHGAQGPLPPVGVLGIGAVTPLGRNLGDIAQQLAQPPAPGAPGKRPELPARRVRDELMADPSNSRRLRRADRFIRMAATAAQDAWAEAAPACADVSMERVGLIVASGLGPHVRGFKFLDGILDCGDTAALPTDFSHSVHGAAAAYIAELLGLRGPSLTITDFEIGFEQGVLLAQCWLAHGTCDRVLVGAVEELGDVMIDCAGRLVQGDSRFAPGEGAVFLTLAPAGVDSLVRLYASALPRSVDLLALQEPLIFSHGAQPPPIVAQRITTFSPAFGHSASGAAFQLLGVLLAMRQPQSAALVTVDSVATSMPISPDTFATLLATRPQA